jgi:serine protease AprX
LVKKRKSTGGRRIKNKSITRPRRMPTLSTRPKDYLTAEVALRPMSRDFKVLEGNEWVVSKNVRNYLPSVDNVGATIKRLKDHGFQILELGTASITVGGNVGLFEKHCNVQLKSKKREIFNTAISKRKVSFFAAPQDQRILPVPENIRDLAEGIVIPEQPIFFTSAFPPHPTPTYFSLHPAADVPMLLQANRLHAEGILGRGTKLGMVDTGFFYAHPYYASQGYNTTTIGVPIPGMTSNTDEYGHGTGIASNALGVAPGVNFLSVKMDPNPTLAFKLAVRQRPNIITNSWGYDIDDSSVLPPELIPLEIEIANAVANGITVLFAAGNHGMKAWPASMSEVIAVGGGYIDENLNLQASSYASSFDSTIYPGRHVPDVCGLVGLAPKGVYITMPTMPNSTVDSEFSGGSFPNGDQTLGNDGWLCASGTSSATPMVAGVIALLLEKKPSLKPDEIKQILEGTTQDITAGVSSMGDAADTGWDAATGYGLVDAYKAWRSIP